MSASMAMAWELVRRLCAGCLLIWLPWVHPYHLSQITAILSDLVVVEALSDAQPLGLQEERANGPAR